MKVEIWQKDILDKAKGGFGLIIAEDNAVEKRGAGFTKLAGLWDDSQIEKHKEFTDRIKIYGTKIFVQIYHAGREASQNIIGIQPVAPSPIHDPAIFEVPHELSIEEVIELEDKFVDSIVRAQKSGYDGIELHGAHGYLINQFVSPFSNKRTDIYGGNLMNRLRFPLNIIKKAYNKVGKDFVITYRISADEFVEGGLTIEDSKIIVPILESAGIKAIHVSGGVYKTGHLPSAPYQATTALFSDLAKEIKKVVNIPVIAVNKINTPFVAESILKQEKADFVSIGRASIADPEFPNKVLEGRLDDIIPCIACDQGCQGMIAKQEPVSCLVNPRTGREGIYDLNKVENSKKVMVIGGGLVGVETAEHLAVHGSKVTVIEMKETHLEEMAGIPKVFMMESLEHNKVKIKLGTKLEEIKENSILLNKNGSIKELEIDQLILAIGSKPNNSLEEWLKDNYKYTKIGDAKAVIDGIEAVKSGYEAALNI